MTTHTPGPWVAVLEGDQRSLGYIREERKTDDGRQIAVAQATKTGRAYSEFRANATLIATAPDLLSMLVETTARLNLCGTGPRDLDIVERANALISKARGES